MSKRQVTGRQAARIKYKHQSYHQRINANSEQNLAQGLVIARFAQDALIEDENNQRIRCSLRPDIDSLVAGDRVIWQRENETQGVVVSRYPRESLLGRPDKSGTIKPVAANITQIMVVLAPKPEVSWTLLDSYLIIAEYLNITASIVLNKADLSCAAIQQTLLKLYEPLGYRVIVTSQLEKRRNIALLELLNEETSVFVGQSGVGKSSIISSILPHETEIATSELSNNFGRHTTSNSIFYHLPTGGAIIDSPGVREFGLWHMPKDEITRCYREFQPFLTQCKYRNCNHCDTPGCAILKAVQENLISRTRYDNYVKISNQFAK
ncbi:ribosome small subunit-dependent GTPase A [Legionella londiniensis]|uniref:Small ribosomal subunit biogenesis GTPase RsgA n=1 Tax=Legionella londiniensis TaxID=45068 RepID=A0A0W0VSC5_9GAMM|nr:ribosome small subunit-dependent GTPase A [Legionella londiniensis]KTD23068.1 EngC GTPase [Legionella londiniensis]STX94085.1 EngC GTPase [Legionella londiniensis]